MNAPAPTGSPATALTAPPRRGVVLVNVGTPEAPTVPAVRAYLREFLGDPGVVDLPAPLRWALLALIILPFRTGRSAHAYQSIWTDQGSPLLAHSLAQGAALQERLPEARVEVAMRYGQPSLKGAVAALKAAGVTDVTVVPMYPQEASATTGSTVKAFAELWPGARVVPGFHAAPGFIRGYARKVKEAVERSGAEYVLFSYHGLPTRQLLRVCHDGCPGAWGQPVPCGPAEGPHAGCYRAQCYATSAALARAAGVEHHGTSFQSRLKGTTWLSPFTDDTLQHLGRRGVKRVAVVCPAFVADCLETLEEIGQRGAETFVEAGGEHLELVPAINDAPEFIDALASLVRARWEDPSP